MSSKGTKPPRPPMARRWSTFLRTVTLRLVLSWTHWRRKAKERQLARLELVELLKQALAAEREKIKELERRALSPALVIPVPEHIPTPEELKPDRLMQVPDEPVRLTEGRPEIRHTMPEDLEPMPDPAEEIGRLIGLPPQPTSPPS